MIYFNAGENNEARNYFYKNYCAIDHLWLFVIAISLIKNIVAVVKKLIKKLMNLSHYHGFKYNSFEDAIIHCNNDDLIYSLCQKKLQVKMKSKSGIMNFDNL